MTTIQTAKKITRNLRDYGLLITFSKASQHLVGFAYKTQTYRIYRINLETHIGKVYSNNDFMFRLIQPQERDTIKQIEDMEEWLIGRVSNKLQSGSICLIAEQNNQVAGFNLVSFGEVLMPIINTTRKFRPTEAWSEQITVNNAFRGKGLATLLRYRTFDELKKRGIKKLYGGTLPANTANLKLSRKVGFTEIVDIQYTKRFSNQRWVYNKLCK